MFRLILLAFWVTFQLSAQTFFFVEQYSTIEKSNGASSVVTPTVDTWFQKGIRGKVGVFAWAQANPNWRQAYAGGSYQFTSWLQAGVGGGVEQADSMARLGSFLYAAKGQDSLFAVYEDGGSGGWHFAVYNHQIGKSRFGVGAHNQAFVGTGPRAEANFGPIKIWSSLLFERGGQNLFFGVRYVYFRE